MSVTEIRSKEVATLQQELIDLLREQFNLRMQKATRQLNQTHRMRNVRRTIARVKTVLREKTGQPS